MKTSALRVVKTVSSPLCCYKAVNVLNIVKDIWEKLILGRSKTNSVLCCRLVGISWGAVVCVLEWGPSFSAEQLYPRDAVQPHGLDTELCPAEHEDGHLGEGRAALGRGHLNFLAEWKGIEGTWDTIWSSHSGWGCSLCELQQVTLKRGDGERRRWICSEVLSAPRGNGQFVHSSTPLKEKNKEKPTTIYILYIGSAAAGMWNGDDIMNCPHPYWTWALWPFSWKKGKPKG